MRHKVIYEIHGVLHKLNDHTNYNLYIISINFLSGILTIINLELFLKLLQHDSTQLLSIMVHETTYIEFYC